MAVLSRDSIEAAVRAKHLSIKPFHRNGLQPASYDLHLHWNLLISPSRHDRGRQIDLRNEPGRKFPVQPGRFVGALSEEYIIMPLSLSARFGLRSEFTRHGLVAFGGIQIDPGFKGRLAVSLFNAGPEPIDLVLGRSMFTLEFNTLDQPASEGYTGEFQDQDDFPQVQRDFILNAHTVSLAEIVALPNELAHLRQRLVLHEASSSHRRGPSAYELALAQGLSPIDNPSTLLGGWPEDEDFDSFMADVKNLRRGENDRSPRRTRRGP